MTVAVTGGAGYIGSHVVQLLEERDERVLIVDDFSTGSRDNIRVAGTIEMDLSASESADELAAEFVKHQVDSVIHFAAKKQVGESVERPLWYYRNNVGSVLSVLDAMKQSDVKEFIFSSSAAVYGMTDGAPVQEPKQVAPINPYGETKVAGEWLARDAAKSDQFKVSILRYFNVAGAGRQDLGDTSVLNLVQLVFQALTEGNRPTVFGNDYMTADGTCIRDYVHILDLASAHLAALDYIRADSPRFDTFNVGTGNGTSVAQILKIINEVTGLDTTPIIGPRRPGDPANVVGDVSRISEELEWQPKLTVVDMIESAWQAWRFRTKNL